MRKVLLAAALAAAVAGPTAGRATPNEGCIAVNPIASNCSYVSSERAGIMAAGDWRVVVHWSGSCLDEVTHGVNGWIRSSANGDNNVEGVLAGWNGSVNTGNYCVEVDALSPGSSAYVGPLAQLIVEE